MQRLAKKQVDILPIICTYSVCASTLTASNNRPIIGYFDDPIRRTRQKNDQEVTLPAGLPGNDAPGWHITDRLGNFGTADRKAENRHLEIVRYHSYIVEIDNTKRHQLGELKARAAFSAPW